MLSSEPPKASTTATASTTPNCFSGILMTRLPISADNCREVVVTANYNEFAQDNGASILYLDENLILQKEVREEIVFWGSIYGSKFVEMPDHAFTSKSAYRTWCWKTTGMMPEKRTPREFDKYMRPRMEKAAVRQGLPGTEYGIEVDEAIEGALAFAIRNPPNLDNGGAVSPGDWVWLETIDQRGARKWSSG